jgi:CRISPR-associated endonuclease Csn1
VSKELQAYYLGLDGGTDSVGWAVSAPNYTVIKKNGKDLWGVRLFESGNTAAERRLNRSARRRTDRKKWRLKLLQEIFDEEITAIDPAFFHRLNESRYWEDDKTVDGADSLFHDVGFNDCDYHNTYKTIYHLRNYLMHCNTKPDIRLVYLAVAHIIKHRGHFLYEGQTLEDTRSFSNIWAQLCNSIEDNFCITLPVDIENDVKSALLNFNGRTSDLSKALQTIFVGDGSREQANRLKPISELLAGKKVSPAKLYNNDDSDECEELKELESFNFKDKSIEELDSSYEEKLGEERFYLIKCAYGVYSWALFSRILPEGQSLSAVKVKQYEKHKSELRLLKDATRRYAPEKYGLIFRAENSNTNYVAYIGKSKTEKRCSKDDFYNFLKKELKKVWEHKDSDNGVKNLYAELEAGQLLPLQVSKENSLIPYQVHLQELEGILTNMRRFYSFLDVPDENGYTPHKKITKLLTFRIPYYVGPLNDAHKDKGFCWIVKRSDERVLPWNFEKFVDEQKCEEKFIGRMTSTCTYLVGEDVLPLNSAIYCRFTCLNELNNLRISGNKISVELKQKIFNGLFLSTSGKITGKKLVDFLNSNGIKNSDGEKITKNDISGIDGDFKSSMSPVLKLKSAFGDNSVDDETVERLIFALTVSGKSSKMLRQRITKILGEKADESIVKKICHLKLDGWGRLSRKLLTEIYHTDAHTGECKSIMDMLWETNDNLMQLLSDAYGFGESIEQFNLSRNPQKLKFDYDSLVKNLYVSPAVKRSIWQTLLITREVRKIMGCDPDKIFVEMARGATADQKNKRTESRKDKLLRLYKACRDDERDWVAEIEALPEDRLRSDKLYLYYTQMGRCMYSGEKIELDDLMHDGDGKDRLYDIDHIYPQAKVKDDSLDNRVLVKRTLNGAKTDSYPIPANMRQPALWKLLLSKELISREKYMRLTRNTGFTDDELAGFINRQLVETRQSTKAVAGLLKQLFPGTEIVYVKAGLVSDFRHEFDFVKCRDANDFHHAKDAYLNVVVGNVYNEKFTKNPLNFVKSGQEYSVNVKTLFGKLDTRKGDRVIWQSGNEGSMQAVKACMLKNTPMVTRYSHEAHGALFDLQPLKKGRGQLPVKSEPLKNNPKLNISRYGGYNKLTGAYFALIAYEKGKKTKKRQKSIESVPLYRATEFKQNPDALRAYFQKQLGVGNVEILIPEIKIGTLFRWNGFPMTFSGRTNNQLVFRCAAELRTTPEQERYLKRIGNYLNRCKEQKKELKIIPLYDKLSADENLMLYDFFTEHLLHGIYAKRLLKQGEFLRESREKFTNLSLEDQVKLLASVLHFFQCNPILTDLSLIGGVSNAGAINPAKNLNDDVPVSIIYQSVTGFFTKEIKLNDL